MMQSNINSLSSPILSNWRWSSFLEMTIKALSVFDLAPCPIDSKFLRNEVIISSRGKKESIQANTWACCTDKIRQARAACISGSNTLSVLNFVISPFHYFELPFFGADFVTLPNGHLIALDLQPALKSDKEHTHYVWEKLIPLHKHWQSFIPDGGNIPPDAKQYFSPGFLWTRIPLGNAGDRLIEECIEPAYKEYLELYLGFLINSNLVSKDRSNLILEGQKNYMNYRSRKDPARGMLKNLYGSEWTESYISNVLFNL